MIVYSPIPKKQDSEAFLLNAGFDSVNNPTTLKKGKMLSAKNVDMTDNGWKRRQGITIIGQTGASRVNGQGAILKESGDILIRAYGTKLQKLVATTWTDVATVTLTDIPTVIVSYNSTDMTSAAADTGTATADSTDRTIVKSGGGMTINAFAGKVLTITSGTGSGQEKLITSNDITTIFTEGIFETVPDATSVYSIRTTTPHVIVTNGTDSVFKYDGTTVTTYSTMVKFHSLEVAHDRLFAARRDLDYLFFSNYATTYFSPNSFIPVNQSGDTISQVQKNIQEVIIYKDNSRYRLSGYSDDQFQLITADERIGCIAPGSVAHGNNFNFFLGAEGIYSINSLENSSLDEGLPISQYISTDIFAHSAAELLASVGWIFDNKYFLSIGTDIFVYDINQSQIKKTHVFTIYNFPEAITSAYSNGGILYLGSVTKSYTFGGNTDNGTTITAEVITGRRAQRDVNRKKIYGTDLVNFQTTTNDCSLEIYTGTDGNTLSLQ